MAHDVNLKVASMQSIVVPAVRIDKNTLERNKQRKPPVVGSKQPLNNSSNQLKASGRPKEFHLYVGNLDPSSTMEQIRDNLTPHGVRVLSCDIVKSSRFTDLRSVAAHVVIDAKDKDTAFSSIIWPTAVTIRSWRQQRQRNDNSSQYKDFNTDLYENDYGNWI